MKKLFRLFFSLFFIWLFLLPALADYSVDSISISAEVNEKGTAQVTQVIQLTFDEDTASVSIPLPAGNISGATSPVYHSKTSTGDNGDTIVTLSGSANFSGTESFTVTYTDEAGYTEDDTGEIFTMNLLSSGWEKEIQSVTYHVAFAGSYSKQNSTYTFEPVLSSGYFGEMSSSELSQTVSGDTADGKITSRMAFDSISLEVLFPAGYFKPVTSLIPGVNLSNLAIAMAVIWLLTIVYWMAKVRTRDVQSVSMRMLAPEGLLPCQLPFAMDGQSCDLAALMLEWANLGYVSFRCGQKKQVMMIREMKMGSERSRAERELFQRIFNKRRGVLMSPGRFSAEAASFTAATRRSLGKIMFDRKGGNPAFVRIPCCLLCAAGIFWLAYEALPAGAIYILLSVLAGAAGFFYSLLLNQTIRNLRALRQKNWRTALLLILAVGVVAGGLFAGALLESAIGVLACVISALLTASGPRRTGRGGDALAQTRGCRAFYENVAWSRLQVSVGDDPRYFQKQLPWATALNVDGIFAKRFERLGTPKPEWIKGLRTRGNNTAALQKQLAPVIRTLRKAFRA